MTEASKARKRDPNIATLVRLGEAPGATKEVQALGRLLKFSTQADGITVQTTGVSTRAGVGGRRHRTRRRAKEWRRSSSRPALTMTWLADAVRKLADAGETLAFPASAKFRILTPNPAGRGPWKAIAMAWATR